MQPLGALIKLTQSTSKIVNVQTVFMICSLMTGVMNVSQPLKMIDPALGEQERDVEEDPERTGDLLIEHSALQDVTQTTRVILAMEFAKRWGLIYVTANNRSFFWDMVRTPLFAYQLFSFANCFLL
jgi:hypothetical protein